MNNHVIAKLGRENHLNTLIGRLPVLTTIYGIQCLMVYHMATEIDIGDFALYMGASLILLVTGLFIHDKYHHVLLYKDHILVYFAPLNTHKKIMYQDIAEIIVPEKECEFSSILIRLKSDESLSLHFVDYPVQVKQVITEIMNGNNVKFEEHKEAA